MTDLSTKNRLDPYHLAQLQGLHLRAQEIAEGYVTGLHRSSFHGFSVEFSEHREYSPGDDLRYVDWKVLGRTDKVYLKQYVQETNLLCYLLVDTSESMQYQSSTAPLSKLEYAQSLAAALAFIVLRQQDSVGLVTYDDQIRHFLKPSSSPTQFKPILSLLEQTEDQNKTNSGKIFDELAERFKRRGIVVIISDCFDEVESLLAGLKHFRHRRHEVILLHTLDPAEIDFPFEQTMLFKGLEATGQVVANPKKIQSAYQKEINHFIQRIKQACRTTGIHYLQVRTDQSFSHVLRTLLQARR